MSEVLSATKTRLSISGWFHGPDISRPAPVPLPRPVMSHPVLADVSEALVKDGHVTWQSSRPLYTSVFHLEVFDRGGEGCLIKQGV